MHKPVIWQCKVYTWHTPKKTFWDISVPVTLRYGHGIYQLYTWFILGIWSDRRTRLYHSCIDILVQQINDLSGRDIHFRFGDHLYRRSRVFLDFLCMDGDEVSSATMCPTTQCTTCWCPKARLSDPDAVFPFRNTEEVREKVAAERRRLLHRDGTPRDRCKAEVCYILCKNVIY